MQRIFISYSRKDMDFVRRLSGDLEKAGCDAWWDVSDLRGGDDWPRVIPAAIEASDFVIIVLSPNSTASEWVEKEYTQALTLRKKIIPIMLAKCSVPFALNTINYVNFSAGDYTDNLNSLLSALGYTGEPLITQSTEKSNFSLPNGLRKFAIPFVLGTLILLTFALTSRAAPVVPSAVTLTPSASATSTPKPATSTASATSTSSPTFTSTETFTPNPTLTSSPTKPNFEILIYCVNSPYAYAINVRSGPGTNYPPMGEPLLVGKCLAFSARNEDETWLWVARNQSDSTLQQYEGGWIFRDLLGLGPTGPIDLPAVTLTPTPTPSHTPTATLTNTTTLTDTPSPTNTDTATLTNTSTP